MIRQPILFQYGKYLKLYNEIFRYRFEFIGDKHDFEQSKLTKLLDIRTNEEN